MTTLELDPAKVSKHFGRHPERGKVMKVFATHTAAAGMKVKNLVIVANGVVVGKRWVENPVDKAGAEISYKWVSNPMQVWPVVALQPLGHNRYLVQVKPEYLKQCLAWLRHNCA